MTISCSLCLSRSLRVLMAGALLPFAACSGGDARKVTIQGSISCQGQPLRSGLVAFHGPGESHAVGSIRADGTFVIADVIPGEVKVAVIEAPHGSKSRADQHPSVPVPDKYRDPESSGLRYSITASTTKLDIELK